MVLDVGDGECRLCMVRRQKDPSSKFRGGPKGYAYPRSLPLRELSLPASCCEALAFYGLVYVGDWMEFNHYRLPNIGLFGTLTWLEVDAAVAAFIHKETGQVFSAARILGVDTNGAR